MKKVKQEYIGVRLSNGIVRMFIPDNQLSQLDIERYCSKGFDFVFENEYSISKEYIEEWIKPKKRGKKKKK